MDTHKPHHIDVLVVGAGISGLASAHWLKKSGASVLVVEKDSDVGGTMKTIREQGYLVETGPNSALETTPLFKELISDTSLAGQFLYANPVGKNRFILRDGRMTALPLSPPAFIKTSLFSTKAKLRVLLEPFIGRGSKEESVAEFVERRLGREFLDYAIDPFVAGVFAGKPDQLSVRAAFPKLYALEEKYGGLVRGMIGGARERKKRAEKAKDRAESFSFIDGMQVLPRAIAEGLGDAVHLSTTVETVRAADDPKDAGYVVSLDRNGVGETIRSRCVILASPAHVTSSLLRDVSRSAASALDRIQYSPVASIVLGYRREDVGHPLNGFGVLIPQKEKRKILGALWSSSLFPGRAPVGNVSFTVFVGGARQPEQLERSDEDLVTLAAQELASIMHISGKQVYYRLTRWQKAIPQYALGYGGIIADVERTLQQHPGLFLCSNYYRGISVGDCVMSARSAADAVAQYLHLREG